MFHKSKPLPFPKTQKPNRMITVPVGSRDRQQNILRPHWSQEPLPDQAISVTGGAMYMTLSPVARW